MTPSQVPNFVHQEISRLGIGLPDGALDRMARFLDLLLNTNRQFNLTAVRSIEPAWRRLILDSLTLLPALKPLPRTIGTAGGAVIDIGSGGGVPGIPAAIARPDLHFGLLEALAKKARFLERVVEALAPVNTTAIHDRAENLGHNPAHRQRYDLAVSRAIGTVSTVLEYSLPLLKVGGRALLMKGPKAAKELASAAEALNLLGAGDLQVMEAYPAGSDSNLVIISVLKDRPTPNLYPRRCGLPKHSPL